MDKINVGGQAVIEGVMIRGPKKYTIAVRKGKNIVLKKGIVQKKKKPYQKWIFFRGAVNMLEMLIIGIKALMWSAQQAGDDDVKLTKKELTYTLIFSFVIGILFFLALPYFLTTLFGYVEEEKPIMFNMVDGAIRIGIFLAYIIGISFMSDIKRLFQYHGAEHKAIHCYEHGKKLTVDNVKKFTTLHPRCGTAFIFIVLIISIFVFSIIPSVIVHYFPGFVELNVWLRKLILFPLRILLVVPIAGISYEILKISDKKKDNILFRMISAPGLALQRITTQKPDKKQIEVAIYSLKKLLEYESTRNKASGEFKK